MNNSNRKISIIGCGWLGLPLGAKLVTEGFFVNGTTTRDEKLQLISQHGIKPFLLNLSDYAANIPVDFFDADTLIVSVPPGTRKTGSDHHYHDIKNLISTYRSLLPERIIYTSSTSVYPDLNKVIDEAERITEENAGNVVLYKTEKLILENFPQALVLRLGGLTGSDRLLIKYFSGKQNLAGGNSPVNLLHRDDAIGSIAALIKEKSIKGIYNICSPLHPTREELYTFLAHQFNVPVPEYAENDTEKWKIISPQKIIKDLGYQFLFENPLDYTYLS